MVQQRGVRLLTGGDSGLGLPPVSDVRTEPCVRIEEPTFTVQIHLSEQEGDESRDEIDHGYELRPLEVGNERNDLVGLFSFEEPLLEAFEETRARVTV